MMNNKRVYQIILIATVLIFTLSMVPAAQAAGPGPNAVLGFLRTLEALNKRNQIYREAGITAKEIETYYDNLIEKTRTMRREFLGKVAGGDISPRLATSYVRIEAGLEAERKIAIQMIEAEKKGARADFKRTLRKEVFNILIASPGAQKLLKDIRETIDGLRQATTAVKDALSANLPTEALANQLSERYGKNLLMKNAAYFLGTEVARDFDRRMGGVLTRLDKPSKLVLGELDEALNKIDELDHHMAKYQNQEVSPLSLLEIGGDLSGFKALDRSKAGADAVATAYTNKISRLGLLDGKNMTEEQMRDRIRRALLGERLLFLMEDAKYRTQFVYCASTSREAYLEAMGKLELVPEEPLDPEKASYLVCYYRYIKDETETDMFGIPENKVAYAALIGLSKEQAAAQEDGEETQAEEEITYISPEDSGEYSIGDAASCDALEFISLELVEGPFEETSDSGSYYCYLTYTINNTHPSSDIVVSWKHDISSRDAGPYWTHPKLGPGVSYDLILRSNRAVNGNWRTEDSNYLMAWFATEECDRYKHQYMATEEEPDKLLTSGFTWKELENPCRR